MNDRQKERDRVTIMRRLRSLSLVTEQNYEKEKWFSNTRKLEINNRRVNKLVMAKNLLFYLNFFENICEEK